MERKIKILVIPADKHGVGLYRSINPHVMLDKMFRDDFDVEINDEINFNNLDYLKNFDIVHFHRTMCINIDKLEKLVEFCKNNGIKTVMDIDDYWDIPQTHPMFRQAKSIGMKEKTIKAIQIVDYVTTTTDIFANRLMRYNKSTFVFPNAVDPEDEQYSPIKNESNKIRFGFIMGSSHEKDMELFSGVVAQLPDDILSKIQIVLCGFDTRGNMTMFDENGKFVGVRPIKPEESVWYRYEKNVTNNYKIVSPQYREFLERFVPNSQWQNVKNETYRREWTKDISTFATHYRNIDVLLAPLDENDFNSVKSELKLIEAGFTNTAVIASNFGPYTIGTKNLFEYGGVMNENGNCILIDKKKAHKDWAKYIKKLVQNPELIDLLKKNLRESIIDKYDVKTVTKKRAEFYKDIIGA